MGQTRSLFEVRLGSSSELKSGLPEDVREACEQSLAALGGAIASGSFDQALVSEHGSRAVAASWGGIVADRDPALRAA